MHLLNAIPGGIAATDDAVDLKQSPGEIVILSAADSELAALSAACATLPEEFPRLRLANLLQLGHAYSVDLYIEQVIRHARLVVVRLLGGQSYWPYGVERLSTICRENGIALAFLPGDRQDDPGLDGFSTIGEDARAQLFGYFREGGVANLTNALGYAASLIGHVCDYAPARPLPPAGLYWPGHSDPDLVSLQTCWAERAFIAQPVAAIVFYRALLQAGDVEPVHALIEALQQAGMNPLPIYVTSLKDRLSADIVAAMLEQAPPDVVLNATSFAIGSPNQTLGSGESDDPLSQCDCPVLQVVFASNTKEQWQEGMRGLSARDLAIAVALPEIDGRILTRAVAFKAEAAYDARTQCSILRLHADRNRADFVARLAARWSRLARLAPDERKVALVLANYPNRDGRIGNGVGLDTPQSAVRILRAMKDAGYELNAIPVSGNRLVEALTEGVTNDLAAAANRQVRVVYPLGAYRLFFASLPESVQQAVVARWGEPDADPHLRDEGFALPVLPLGNVAVMIQPARGHDVDPAKTYHDPDLVPPHYYFAAYAWLRDGFMADAVIHCGKHGNLEWLPGKALALSEGCIPEAVLGPLPQLYPFIVNDPGEGTQAKRRTAAVIIDHLTPPLTRAEIYGDLAALERLVDEYYEASGLDRRRLPLLADRILAEARRIGLDADCNIALDESAETALVKLDNQLCDLKELQIRDGLHVFGQKPEGEQLIDLLVALVRLPRGATEEGGKGGNQSILRSLSIDLDLGCDPLDIDYAAEWTGPRPAVLEQLTETPWRSFGDTVERLEILAKQLIGDRRMAGESWHHTRAVLEEVDFRLRPAVLSCGHEEMQNLLRGLDGRFVPPGPSGAPTRGRPDVLPTGRNFYSLDARCLPTPAAWTLGWRSADALLQRHRQDHGEWPHAILLNAWGTANMRTGGDDIAQALALIGARPVWETASGRVTGFEIVPLDLLDRPRIDVTLKVSGFFRDAFPQQVALFASAVRAVQALDEPDYLNPLAARATAEAAQLVAQGVTQDEARRRAGYRVFGTRPGAYGAGLQALIDERGWENAEDLARAYIAWGAWAYGAESPDGADWGVEDQETFTGRLARVDTVVQNQDNREHDLLDSDEYYQFEGGAVAAVRHISGTPPVAYHTDHSRPENPRIRRLEEEISRIVRGRAANPKWLEGIRRHGYRGAFEIAATLDYLFAFAATTGLVRDDQFDLLYDAYLGDAETRRFIETNNPAAAREIAARFGEAIRRGLWKPRANIAAETISEMSAA